MSASETKRELLDYLDKATREMSLSSARELTTAKVAYDINVSRNLASQYLNELVREGLVVKVNSHPVLYFHRRSLERFLQASLDQAEYPSMTELLGRVHMLPANDFDKAIGHGLSLDNCISQLKSAMEYPPKGLPVLLVGQVGTGKALLARLTHEYGLNNGILPTGARHVRVDCSRYAGGNQSLRLDLLGTPDKPGLIGQAAGGTVFFEEVSLLSESQRDLLLSVVGRQELTSKDLPVRMLLSTARPATDPLVRQLARAVPVMVLVPSLAERGAEERASLVRHFLRAEGRRVSADVSIGRGALRALVSTSFEDNVDGLRSCIINCCVGAYRSTNKDHLVIRSYNLPASVLASVVPQPDDDQLTSCNHGATSGQEVSGVLRHLQGVLDVWETYCAGGTSFGEFISEATSRVRAYQDHLSFESPGADARAMAYEQVLCPIFEEVGMAHDVDLSRKSVRLFSLALVRQLWGGELPASWVTDANGRFRDMLAILSLHMRPTATIVDQVVGSTRAALGVEPDALARTLLFLDLNATVSASRTRECVGIVLCHGYSTATSIADAANRILHSRVFEAIDMPYEQQVSDVVGPLRRLVERYAYCTSVVLLVDMGSLADACDAISGITNADVFVVSGVSTGLALEVGSTIKARERIESRIGELIGACAPTYRILRGDRLDDAVVFCSESGMAAAEKIRNLFAESLPPQAAERLVVADYRDLAKEGTSAPVFSHHSVRAIVGTMDPGIEGIPFVALEDLLWSGKTDRLDRVLVRWVGEQGLDSFHGSVWKRLTLQNVIESLVILNPERLYAEVEAAVRRLQDLTGEVIAPAATLGLYVHLCCLVERLVTKVAVEAYADEELFSQKHAAFIQAFRASFQDISSHYRVEVPTAEVAYVYDYIHSKSATRERPAEIVSGLADE